MLQTRAVPAAHFPPPSHLSLRVQALPSSQLVVLGRGAYWHVPVEQVPVAATHCPCGVVQAEVLQQEPSTQKPDSHTRLSEQVVPSAFLGRHCSPSL